MHRSHSLLFTGLLLTTLASGQDDCSSPLPLAGSGSFAYDTTSATSSGFDGGGSCGGGSSAVYSDHFFLWTAPSSGSWFVDTFGTTYNTRLSVHDGTGCGASCIAYSNDAEGTLQSKVVVPNASAGEQFLIQVGGAHPFFRGPGILGISLDPCDATPDDGFEENDDCASAVPLGAGFYPDLHLDRDDQDYYELTVPGDNVLSVSCFTPNTSSLENVTLRLFQPGCGSQVLVSFGDTFTFLNASSSPVTWILKVEFDMNRPDDCHGYDLDVDISLNPCTAASDDAFEDNDTCNTATPLGAGSYAGLRSYLNDADYYRITAQPGEELTATIPGPLPLGSIRMRLYEGGCTLLVDNDIANLVGSGVVTALNNSASPVDFYLEVTFNTGLFSCNDYELEIELDSDACQSGQPDAFEDNDTCATAAPLPVGVWSNLQAQKAFIDSDYYRFSVPAGEMATADVLFLDSNGNIEALLWSDGCAAQLDTSLTNSDDEQVSWTNSGPLPVDVILQVYVNAGDNSSCNGYQLVLTVTGDPCTTPGSEDDYEDGDDCDSAIRVGNGTLPAMFASKSDPDFFVIDVAAGATLQVDLTFVHADGDVDCYLYDAGGCAGGPGGALAASNSSSDDEQLVHTNNTGTDQTYTLEVQVFQQSVGECNTYALAISGARGALLGQSYCAPANQNSTGSPGAMNAVGDADPLANDLGLSAWSLPENQFAYFLASQTQAFTRNPGGSQGDLCLGGNIARFTSQVGQISNGGFSITVDTQSVPANPVTPILAGETWSFQCWYRDFNPAATSNFTHGQVVTFQ